MTATPQPEFERCDVRTIVGGGAVLGLLAGIGVALFAVLSRVLQGGAVETVVQSVIVLAGAVAASYLPAAWVRPRSPDAVAWTALTGLLGALGFTVIDVVVLRPLHFYHWTWDAVGGGSGFWYIPVWWMGAATLAWLGAWVVALAARATLTRSVGLTVALSLVTYVILVAVWVGPGNAAIVALAYAIALLLSVPLTALLKRRDAE